MEKSDLEGAGYGLFAKLFIPANTLFAKYHGVFYLREEGIATSPPGVALLLSCLILKYSLLNLFWDTRCRNISSFPCFEFPGGVCDAGQGPVHQTRHVYCTTAGLRLPCVRWNGTERGTW